MDAEFLKIGYVDESVTANVLIDDAGLLDSLIAEYSVQLHTT